MKKRASKTKAGGRGLRPARRASAVIHSEQEKNSALSSPKATTTGKPNPKNEDAELENHKWVCELAGLPLNPDNLRMLSEDQKKKDALHKEQSSTSHKLAREFNLLNGRLHVGAEEWARLVRVIANPLLLREHTEKKVAADDADFVKRGLPLTKAGARGLPLKKDGGFREERVQNIMHRLRDELPLRRTIAKMNQKAVEKRLRQIKKEDRDIFGMMRGTPQEFDHYRAAQWFHFPIASEISGLAPLRLKHWKLRKKRNKLANRIVKLDESQKAHDQARAERARIEIEQQDKALQQEITALEAEMKPLLPLHRCLERMGEAVEHTENMRWKTTLMILRDLAEHRTRKGLSQTVVSLIASLDDSAESVTIPRSILAKVGELADAGGRASFDPILKHMLPKLVEGDDCFMWRELPDSELDRVVEFFWRISDPVARERKALECKAIEAWKKQKAKAEKLGLLPPQYPKAAREEMKIGAVLELLQRGKEQDEIEDELVKRGIDKRHASNALAVWIHTTLEPKLAVCGCI